MRIISGKFRRRLLIGPPKSAPTRPIPDRVKESIFSLLRGHLEGARVLDAFAGTGAIGLEAISRGARECVFVERDKKAADVLERNIQTLGCTDQSAIVRGDALGTAVLTRLASMGGADLMFFDPPYPLILDATPISPSGVGGGGWVRMKTQLERCIPHLSDHGYLLLRTPWPFRHPDDLSLGISDDPDALDEPAPARPHRGKGSGGRGNKNRRGREARDIETSWIGSEIDIERIQRETRELEARLNDSEPDEPSTGGRGAGKRGSPIARGGASTGLGASGGSTPPAPGFKRHLTIKDLDDESLDVDFNADPEAELDGEDGDESHDSLGKLDPHDEHDEHGEQGQGAFDVFNDVDEMELSEEDADGASDARAGASTAAHPREPAPTFHPVDLTLAGAVGPETHVYGSTAMHLYMRKR